MFRIQKITRWVFGKITPVFRYRNIKYRIKTPESFSIAKEIFFDTTYIQFLSENPIETFIDIGCNTGFFTTLLAAYNDANTLEGVLIDADPEVLEEAEWHKQANNLSKCDLICAIVGPDDISSAEFYVSDFNISSSAIPFDEKHPFPIEASKRIEVPVIHLDQLIKKKFKDKRVDVIKIDIEGSELDLLSHDLGYLKQVDWIILEWHKWVVTLDATSQKLEKYNFKVVEVLKEDTICGLALYENQYLSGEAL